MQGDFSVLNFDPYRDQRVVTNAADGVLRNVNGVLHQQGRVTIDADLTEEVLLELGWDAQAARDIIGTGVCAVPSGQAQAFLVDAAWLASDGRVMVKLWPGRAWVDGILTRLPGLAAPAVPVVRTATYLGPEPGPIGDNVRDAVILEVSQEALHGYQYPQVLIEPALGGPDTAERGYVNFRLRLVRLTAGESCHNIVQRLRDAPDAKGKLSVSLAPVVTIAGDCPVVGGGGYTGFEHCLYRIEIADVTLGAPPRFKWSQWNGGLVGRGLFDANGTPARVVIDAGRPAIVNSGLTSFYLEALQYDELAGTWAVVYGTTATLNTEHDLELADPQSFGVFPSPPDPVFFRLWNGIADIAAYTDSTTPVELRDGIRLVFDAPPAASYRPGDYWTFSVRAGEIANPQILIDDAPPAGIAYHRVPLAEVHWNAAKDTRNYPGTIDDCRQRFRPLTSQKVCCTYLVGDGVTSFGDFDSLEAAAAQLPDAGGELCLLPGTHRASLRLQGRSCIRIHGCRGRTLVLPAAGTQAGSILHFVDCVDIAVCGLDLVTYDGVAVRIEGTSEGSCKDLRVHDNRMIARSNAIRATNATQLVIAGNRLHLLDTADGFATISCAADDVLIERNTLVLLPFAEPTPGQPTQPSDDPSRDPADPCAKPPVLYSVPSLVLRYALAAWHFIPSLLVAQQPYRALGGIHVRAGSERVRISENRIAGGGGNGITLGGDLGGEDLPPPPGFVELPGITLAPAGTMVNVAGSGHYLALVQDEQGNPLPEVDVSLHAESSAADRSDAQGLASVKTAPGRYALRVAPQYRVLQVAESPEAEVPMAVITLAAAVQQTARGFLHEIRIEANDISMMGLSGIGFATAGGTSIAGTATQVAATDPKVSLLTSLDATIRNFALTPLVNAADAVRVLEIAHNRLHHNLLNPFTKAMLDAVQVIGRGGISLAVVDTGVIRHNEVHHNGPRATDPVCGIFVGYCDNLDISDNTLADNGADTTDYARARSAGLRSGIYVRFAAALTARLSASTGRNLALRVHGNRVDQPAGRALTAYAFGPVSVTGNHLNSEFSGLSNILDAVVGGTLILNLGGLHRLLVRARAPLFTHALNFAAAAEQSLPGGETMFDDNFQRLGIVNRSLSSQLMLCLDDLGYASNTSSVFRGDPFFANALLAAVTVRATASRLREDVKQAISLLTAGFHMNMTALNQGDHCVVALPQAHPPNPLPTIDQLNQVQGSPPQICGEFVKNPAALGHFFLDVFAANGAQTGGTLPPNAFNAGELAAVVKRSSAQAVQTVNATQVDVAAAYQAEAMRMTAKYGAAHPVAQALAARGQAGAQINRVLAPLAETLVAAAPDTPPGGASLSGRFVNDRGQGLADYNVDLLRTNSTLVETVGRTDASGFFSASYDNAYTLALQKEGKLFLRVADLAKREVLLDRTELAFAPDAQLQVTLVVPVGVVPKSTAAQCTPTTAPTTAPTQGPTQGLGTPRTPLDKLQIDEETRKRLQQSGIVDVEGIVEAGGVKLTKMLGNEDQAHELVEMAHSLLGRDAAGAPPRPSGPGGR